MRADGVVECFEFPEQVLQVLEGLIHHPSLLSMALADDEKIEAFVLGSSNIAEPPRRSGCVSGKARLRPLRIRRTHFNKAR